MPLSVNPPFPRGGTPRDETGEDTDAPGHQVRVHEGVQLAFSRV